MTIASAVGGQVTGTSRPRTRFARIATVVAGAQVHRARARSRRRARRTSDDDPGDDQPARPGRPRRTRRATARRRGRRRGRGWWSSGPRASSRAPPRAATRSGWIATASARMPSARRGPGRVTMTSSIGRTSPFLTAVSVVPAGPRGDLLGRDAVRGVAEQDDLRVEGEDLLRLDLVDAVRAAGERVAAGDRDHLGAEVVGRRAEVAGRRVELVVDARLRQARRGGRDLVERRPGSSR